MENQKRSELVNKVASFIDALNVKENKDQLIFCIVADEDGRGMMKFEGMNTELAKCFADYIRQKPELAKIMIAALYATDYIGEESAFEMAKKDYQEYKEQKS